MLLLDVLPDALQQIAIATSLLYFAYIIGRRRLLITKNKLTLPHDEYYHHLVRCLLVLTGFIYAEAVFQTTLAMAEDAAEEETPDSKTTQWLKQHSKLFWFVLACRQSVLMAILGYELMSETKVKKLVWFGAIVPFIQWHVGLFSTDPMSGAVVGLLFETLTPLLLVIYMFKICMCEGKIRAAYACLANLWYLISALPVLFLALEMRGPHEVLYLTVFFGVLSFFCWSRAVIKTPQRSKSISLEFVRVPLNTVTPEDLEPSFTIGEEDPNV